MTPIPKPTPEPRARKRLRRSSPIARSRAPIARKVRVQRRKLGPAAEASREAERLCSRITLASHPLCECGCGQRSTDAAHILNKKAHPRVRFYLRNLLALAHSCHERLRDANVNPAEPSAMRDLVLSLPWGRDRWESILHVSRGPKHDIRDWVEGLRQIAGPMGIR